jgi:hypothetical protein
MTMHLQRSLGHRNWKAARAEQLPEFVLFIEAPTKTKITDKNNNGFMAG